MHSEKMARLAGVLYVVTVLALVLIPLFVAVFLILMMAGVSMTILPNDVPSSGLFLWLGVAIGFVPLIALLWVLNALRHLFAQYRDGAVLTEASAQSVLQAGKGLIWVAVLNIAVQPVTSALLSWEAPSGQREVAVGFGMAEIGFLFAAGLLTLIGWALSDAARQAEENKGFV
ncbi:MAG: hypothetical protein ACU0GG_21130 [Paracoccaceae bacterium]